MKFINIKTSWLFLLIPIGIIFFVITPEIKTRYSRYNYQQIKLQEDIVTLDSLSNLVAAKRSDLNKIKTLSITIPIYKLSYKREFFIYLKTGGMLIILAFMGIGMFGFSYLSAKKKSSSKNKLIDFSFEDSDNDPLGQRISWTAVEKSGSNFASEVLKKSLNAYKITSSSYTKVFAWSFFLVGLNYLSFSYIEFYQISNIPLGIMKAGKIFFTSGGVFLIIGMGLILMFSTKVYINTQKRKIIIDGTVLHFKQVYALQVLQKFVEGGSSAGYFSYELNLVTKDGDRHNLLNHGDKDYILSDMIKLSRLFKVPVWNKILM